MPTPVSWGPDSPSSPSSPARAARSLASPPRAFAWASPSVVAPPPFLALPALVFPAWHLWRSARPVTRAYGIRLAAALLGPALVVGLALAAYNHARFGDPVEFGFSYSVNSFTDAGAPTMSPAFVAANLSWYYFSLPGVGPYFPFFFPVAMPNPPADYFGYEPVHGQAWLTFALMLGALAWATTSTLRKSLRPAARPLLSLALMSVGPFALVIPLGFRANRYLGDFQPIFVLAFVGFLGLLLARRISPLVRWGLALVIPLGLLATVGSALQQYDRFVNLRPATTAKITRWADWPAVTARQLGLLSYGPISFDVTFPAAPATPRLEPLVTIGLPDYADMLVAGLHPGNVVEFLIDNSKLGGPRSAPRYFEPGRTYHMTLETGALHPPVAHDWGDGRTASQRAALKRRVILTLDDEEIINGTMLSNDAPPWTIALGRNDVTHRPYANRFSGEISSLQRIPSHLLLGDPITRVHDAANPPSAGLFRLEIELPTVFNTPFPLLATGETGAGNLLSLRRLDDTSYELALDSWGIGLMRSGPLPLPANALLRLDVVIPSMFSADAAATAAHHDTLQVWHGATCLWQVRIPAHLTTFRRTLVGANPQHFSSAVGEYDGQVLRLRPTAEQLAARRAVALALPPP